MEQNNFRIILVCGCGLKYERKLFANHNGQNRCRCGQDIPAVNAAMKNDLLYVRLGEETNGRIIFSGRLEDLSREFKI